MTITVKMKVSRVASAGDPENPYVEVELVPDTGEAREVVERHYAQGRTAEWWRATPSIVLTLSEPDAIKQFEAHEAFTVTFEAGE